MPTKRKSTRKPTNSQKQADPGLNLVLKRLDKFDQRFDALDQKIDAVDRKVDALRQETAAEFKAVRNEMTQGFDSLRQEFKAEMKHVSNAAYEHYLRIETERRADAAEYRSERRQLLTAMDTAAKNYDAFKENRDSFNDGIRDLQHEVKELKKRDMEKAAAIEKIEKQIKAA